MSLHSQSSPGGPLRNRSRRPTARLATSSSRESGLVPQFPASPHDDPYYVKRDSLEYLSPTRGTSLHVYCRFFSVEVSPPYVPPPYHSSRRGFSLSYSSKFLFVVVTIASSDPAPKPTFRVINPPLLRFEPSPLHVVPSVAFPLREVRGYPDVASSS